MNNINIKMLYLFEKIFNDDSIQNNDKFRLFIFNSYNEMKILNNEQIYKILLDFFNINKLEYMIQFKENISINKNINDLNFLQFEREIISSNLYKILFDKFNTKIGNNSIIRNTNKFSTTNMFSEIKNIYIIDNKYEKDCLLTGEFKSNNMCSCSKFCLIF